MSTIAIDAPGAAGAARIGALLRSLPVGVRIAGAIVALYLLAAVLPGLLQPHDPFATDLDAALQGPSVAHPFGTDQSGRDVLSRVIEGTRQSLAIGVGATALSFVFALALGIAAGLGGKLVDGAINRFLEVLFAFPILFVALLFVAVFGQSVTTQIIAVAIGTAPGYARIIRGQFLTVKGSAYVEAARAVGHSYGKIVRQHVFPNAMRPLVVMFTLGVGQAIVWASGLAFLGLGVAPPSPEWGALLDAGRAYVTSAWWLELTPGLAIVVFALSVTIVGRHVQERLEGKVKVQPL
ncbi:MAG: ABC transporter permease [Solirubrobacteraceae bacterium]|nr:ABC transporter permease [Solirubrobacteraceae bacterium]